MSILVPRDNHQVLRRTRWTKIYLRMPQIKSWTVSDAFWAKIEPLIPAPQRSADRAYLRKPGGGRKPMPARQIFSAIVYVLRTGCQWKALPILHCYLLPARSSAGDKRSLLTDEFLERSHSSCIPIAAGTKPCVGIIWSDGFESFGDSLVQGFGRPRLGRAQELFELGPGLLDRVQVR